MLGRVGKQKEKRPRGQLKYDLIQHYSRPTRLPPFAQLRSSLASVLLLAEFLVAIHHKCPIVLIPLALKLPDQFLTCVEHIEPLNGGPQHSTLNAANITLSSSGQSGVPVTLDPRSVWSKRITLRSAWGNAVNTRSIRWRRADCA
jgi:hypothetical protein